MHIPKNSDSRKPRNRKCEFGEAAVATSFAEWRFFLGEVDDSGSSSEEEKKMEKTVPVIVDDEEAEKQMKREIFIPLKELSYEYILREKHFL